MARGRHDDALASIERAERELARLPIPAERARTLLAKGQLLRRTRRKRLAREALQSARAIFEQIGMPLWVAKADRELARIGIRPAAPTDLTETERRVAELATEGLTNREVAARAFLSPKSVEDVLGRVYGKLGIHSRAELGARMASERESKRAGTR
jgi:DNA-binding NarL/FixJ family response regulator